MQVRGLFALILTVLLTAVLVTVPVSGQGAVRVFVDGEQVLFDQPPIVQGSRVLVPLRGVFEKMGATVEWHPSTRTVLAAKGSTLVELRIGSRIAKVNDRPVTLDVPAMIVRGRTLVPLRFVSESMGGLVQYQSENRTVLIWTSGQAGQPPSPPPPAAGQTITGVITQVRLAQQMGDQPRIVVESGSIAYTITVTTDTAITRVETSSNIGGSVGVAALRPGDDAQVTLSNNVATRIRATYVNTSGRIDQIARTGRTIILTDGRTIKYVPNVVVSVNGQPAQSGADALRQGQFLDPIRLNPTTREAWEINIASGAAGIPQTPMSLNVNRPQPGDTVSNPIDVRGRTVAGSRVQIVVTWFLGVQVGSQTVTANGEGRFSTRVQIQNISPNSPYLLTVTATHSDFGQEQRQFTVTVQ